MSIDKYMFFCLLLNNLVLAGQPGKSLNTGAVLLWLVSETVPRRLLKAKFTAKSRGPTSDGNIFSVVIPDVVKSALKGNTNVYLSTKAWTFYT